MQWWVLSIILILWGDVVLLAKVAFTHLNCIAYDCDKCDVNLMENEEYFACREETFHLSCMDEMQSRLENKIMKKPELIFVNFKKTAL